jgi:hypothetical protein
MTFKEAFDLVDAGQGRWDVQRSNTVIVAGQILRTPTGFVLYDWLGQRMGTFDMIDDALRYLLHATNQQLRHRGAA